jgi:hypothetical protein
LNWECDDEYGNDYAVDYGYSLFDDINTYFLIKIRCNSYLYGYSPKFVITLYDANYKIIKRSMGELDKNGYPFSNIYLNTTAGVLYLSVDALESDYAVSYQFYAILDDKAPDFDIWNPTGNLNGYRPGSAEGYVPLYIILLGLLSVISMLLLACYGISKALLLRKRGGYHK